MQHSFLMAGNVKCVERIFPLVLTLRRIPSIGMQGDNLCNVYVVRSSGSLVRSGRF